MLVDTSSAKIEKNQILSNLKAGIARGGSNCIDTFVINNVIKNGSSEGIYIAHGGEAWIIRNIIDKNYFGIISNYSRPLI